MRLFQDRFDAGHFLAEKLERYRGTDNPLVLGLPRGGVPVAFEVAKSLEAPLDVFLVRKLGLPGHRELAMGAISTGGVRVLNRQVIDAFQVPDSAVEHIANLEQMELERQERLFRESRHFPKIAGRTVILVDDGLATGSTMRAAAEALRQQHPRRLVLAVPVGAAETCEAMKVEADDVICAIDPADFMAVGSWYEDFSPTSDQMVQQLLEEAATWEFDEETSHTGDSIEARQGLGSVTWPYC
jgi:putative phosphoribosyl transferase